MVKINGLVGMNEENTTIESEVEVKDSQTFSIKDTKMIVLKNVPEDLWIRYRDYSRKYAHGNWTRALQLMIDLAEIQPILTQTLRRVDELEERLLAFQTEMTESKGRKKVKTFGGGDE